MTVRRRQISYGANRKGNGTISRRFGFGNRRLANLTRPHRPKLQFSWASAISQDEWEIYRSAIQAIRQAGIRFMLGGGFALAAFTGRWRDTKDIDFYIMPEDRDAVVTTLTEAGFADYFSRRAYDRKWIYRNVKSDVIVDIIWSMANQRAQVDPIWFERAGLVTIRGERISTVPLEEFLWCKLYIIQRDHCDWTDLFNLLYAVGDRIDWRHLFTRLEDDVPLLKALLMAYGWLCPEQARQLPGWLWRHLELAAPVRTPPPKRNRIRLLDSRAWFSALHPKDKKLDV